MAQRLGSVAKAVPQPAYARVAALVLAPASWNEIDVLFPYAIITQLLRNCQSAPGSSPSGVARISISS